MDDGYIRYVSIRDSKGLTDYRVSEIAGISRSTFTNWKTGKSRPKIDKLTKIADALGCSINDIQPKIAVEFKLNNSKVLIESEGYNDDARGTSRLINCFSQLDSESKTALISFAQFLLNQKDVKISAEGEYGDKMKEMLINIVPKNK